MLQNTPQQVLAKEIDVYLSVRNGLNASSLDASNENHQKIIAQLDKQIEAFRFAMYKLDLIEYHLHADEIERLSLIVEEAGEVLQILGKVFRFGWDSHDPNDASKKTNRSHLATELGDLMHHIDYLRKFKDIANDEFELAKLKKAEKLPIYLRYQKNASEIKDNSIKPLGPPDSTLRFIDVAYDDSLFKDETTIVDSAQQNDNLTKLKHIASDKESGWQDNARFRNLNEQQLDEAFDLAIAVLDKMRSMFLSKEDLASLLFISLDDINYIVKSKSYAVNPKTVILVKEWLKDAKDDKHVATFVPDESMNSYFIDDSKFFTKENEIDGAELRAKLHTDKQDFAIYLERNNDKPDILMNAYTIIKLGGTSHKFYTVPPANFGTFVKTIA